MSANDSLKVEDVRVALEPFLRMRPSKSFCKKVKKKAQEICKAPINGDAPAEHGVGQLENYLAALEECGWHTQLFSKSGAELKPVLIQKAKEDFERAARRRRQETEAPSSSRSTQWKDKDSAYEPSPEPDDAFDVDRVPGLREMLERVEEQGRYFYGFVLIPPWAAHVLERCAPKAVAIDAGHCSEEQKGVILEIVISDANRQNVSLAVAHFVDNESDRIVDPFFAFASKHLALNRAEVAIHKDGGKPFISARKKHMPHAKALLCEKHAKNNILEKVKVPGAVEKYGFMVNALTSAKYNFWRQQAPARLLEYLETRRLPESELFLAPFAQAGGKTQATISTLKRSDPSNPPVVKPRTTSGFVESEMNANKSELWGSIRHSTPTEMLVKVCEKMVQTNASHQVDARKCATKAPPKVMHMLAVLEKTATERRHKIEPIGEQQDGQAKVYPDMLRSPSLYNVTQLAPAMCSCGLPHITGFPCIDLVILAKKALGATDFTGLLQKSDTTKQWQQQYDFNFALCLPATAVVFMQPPTSLLFPIFAPKPSGAPRRARYKSWQENLTKTARRAVPASASPAPPTPGATSRSSQPPSTKPSERRPYTCGKCGVLKKGHTCK